MNILVADDEDLIRRNFIKRINRLNIQVDCIYEAKHGLEALDMLKKHEIQICLLDIIANDKMVFILLVCCAGFAPRKRHNSYANSCAYPGGFIGNGKYFCRFL